MNTKGGCGKSTVATNLASYFAAQGEPTALFDYDPQGSSTRWLKVRPKDRPAIHGVAAYEPTPDGITRTWQLRVPPQTRYVIRDTPAGYGSFNIDDRTADSDVILIPVLPSAIDIHSTADFIRDLLLVGKVRSLNKRVAIIANRTRIRTRSLDKLDRFLRNLDIPVVTQIRDTQHYVHAAEQGIGVHELKDYSARQDVGPWAEIFEWLQPPLPDRQTQTTPVALPECEA